MNSIIKKFRHGSGVRFNIGVTLLRQILAAGAQLLIVVLIARELGAEGNGLYAMAVLVPSLLANFFNMGVGAATVYYTSRGEHTPYQSMSGNLKLALILVAAGLSVAVPGFYFWGNSFLPGVPGALVYTGMAAFPLMLLTSYLSTILQGLEDFKSYNLTILLPPFVNLITLVLSLYAIPGGDSVKGVLLAYLAGHISGLICALWLVSRSSGTKPSPLAFPAFASKVMSYGLRAHLSNILAFINYRADIFLVNFFLSPVATGVYVIAVQLAEKLWMISQAASTVLLPRLSTMHDKPTDRLALSHKGFIATSLATALAAIPASAAVYWLTSFVFGEEYLDVIPAFLWLIPGIIAGAGSRIYANCIAAAGKPQWNMYSSVVVLLVNVTGNILLIPDHGIAGAAWSTSIAYGLNAAIKYRLVRML